MSDLPYVLAVIVALTVVSVVNRSFFFLSRRELVLPEPLQRGLRYAPLAALVAVIAPEIVLVDGALLNTPYDARLYAALLAAGYALWRRDMLGTIGLGMAVLLGLRLGLGW